jgi:hypothetical protein
MRSISHCAASKAAYAAIGALAVASAPARAQDDLRAITGLAGCYADGIDAIGAGNHDAGASIWRQCFADDLRFEMRFPGVTLTCPGEKCPLPAGMKGLAQRAALARGTFERAGYVATSHHLTSLSIEQAQPEAARLRAHLQAWHFRKDGTAVLGLGTWQVEARRTPAGWRIVDEKLESPLRVVIPKAEVPKTE